MSDNAIEMICFTVLLLGFFVFLGFLVWLTDRAPQVPPASPSLKAPPMMTTWTTKTIYRPSRGAHRPKGKPVDLSKVTPPQQPSAVKLPNGGTTLAPDTRPDPLVPPKGGSGTQPKRGEQ